MKNNKFILTIAATFILIWSLFSCLCMAKQQNRNALAAASIEVSSKNLAQKQTQLKKADQSKNVGSKSRQAKWEWNVKSAIQKLLKSNRFNPKTVVSHKSLTSKLDPESELEPGLKLDTIPDLNVAIISCCYGGFEATTKPVVKQSVSCDKIFFTDNPKINNCGNWIIDTTPYHLTHNKYLNTDYTNSWKKNKTNYMISKYYKAQFMDIPRLQKYDYVFVIDGTMEITNKDCVKMLIEKIEKENTNMVCWMHEFRNGELLDEINVSSNDPRWNSTKFKSQNQPFQDCINQYNCYVKNGYTTDYWRKQNIHNNYGVFCGGFIFYKNNDKTRSFIDSWYEEILKWTTQDQISLPYVLQTLQKNSDYKFSVLPDKLIEGCCHSKSNVHIRHGHGK